MELKMNETEATGRREPSQQESTSVDRPSGHAALNLERPAPGQAATFAVKADQSIVVGFDPAEARVAEVGGALVLSFPDAARITLAGFGAANPHLVLPGGTVVAGNVILAQLQGAAEVLNLETAAGPTPAGGGGHGYTDDLGAVIGGLSGQDVLDPTDLVFPLPAPVQTVTGLADVDTGSAAIPPVVYDEGPGPQDEEEPEEEEPEEEEPDEEEPDEEEPDEEEPDEEEPEEEDPDEEEPEPGEPVPAAFDNAAHVPATEISQEPGETVTTVLLDFEHPFTGYTGYNTAAPSNDWHTSGDKSLKMIPAGNNYDAGDLESDMGLPAGTLTGWLSDAQAAAGATMAFTAAGGDAVSFDWYFDSKESGPGAHDPANDDASFYVLMKDGAVVEKGIIDPTGATDDTGTKTIALAEAGDYVLCVGVANIGDDQDDSVLYIDNLRLAHTGMVDLYAPHTVTGNVIVDPNDYADSADPWGATDVTLGVAKVASVFHDGVWHDLSGGTVAFATAFGGSFQIDEDGNYSYTTPATSGATGSELFTYRLSDGSTFSDADLTVKVVADASLLGEDYVGDGGANGHVGTGGDDVLWGLGGDDILVGGDGDDILIGGVGDDLMSGGSGADKFVYITPLDGQDVVADFNITDGDRIDLNSLFDSLGVPAADRAAAVSLAADGADKVITIAGAPGFSLTLAGHGLTDDADIMNQIVVAAG